MRFSIVSSAMASPETDASPLVQRLMRRSMAEMSEGSPSSLISLAKPIAVRPRAFEFLRELVAVHHQTFGDHGLSTMS
jgi:hypothetical protein